MDNLSKFMKGKNSNDEIFDLITPNDLNKYLQELCGLGAAKVYSKASQTQISTDGGGLVITFNLWDDPKDQNNSVFVSVDVMRVKDKLFDYIFDSMFAMIPFAPSKIEPPKDPAFIVVK
ncbi:hypothetical protein EOM86_04530 [Candidatus Nomurabacteria bacterium]|nr:hypothetical protein [Candidatus Nomurabacteria bacterium]